MHFGYGKMKRKNYALSLSWSITTRILLPIFLACGIALGFAINDLFDKVYFTILASLGFVAGFYLLGFISLFVTGIFLYKRQGFRQDENYMYQGKRKLKKDNIIAKCCCDFGIRDFFTRKAFQILTNMVMLFNPSVLKIVLRFLFFFFGNYYLFPKFFVRHNKLTQNFVDCLNQNRKRSNIFLS